MTTAHETQALGVDVLAQLQTLAAEQDALWTASRADDGPGWRDRDDERRLHAAEITDVALRAWAAATGRCPEHLTSGDLTYALTESTHRCRNRARDGYLCGTHQPSWDHQLLRTRARVESNRKLRESQAVADQLRALGLETTGIGADHVALSLDTARALIDHLTQTGGLPA